MVPSRSALLDQHRDPIREHPALAWPGQWHLVVLRRAPQAGPAVVGQPMRHGHRQEMLKSFPPATDRRSLRTLRQTRPQTPVGHAPRPGHRRPRPGPAGRKHLQPRPIRPMLPLRLPALGIVSHSCLPDIEHRRALAESRFTIAEGCHERNPDKPGGRGEINREEFSNSSEVRFYQRRRSGIRLNSTDRICPVGGHRPWLEQGRSGART